MSLSIFNAAMLIGWIMILIGGCLINLGAGLVFSGLLLIAMTIVVSRIAGIYAPKAREKGQTDVSQQDIGS